MIVVPTIHLDEERQCDPDLSFLFDVSNTTVTTAERRPGTRQPNHRPSNRSHRVDRRMPSRFIRSVSLKMLNVDLLIVNGDVLVFDTRKVSWEIAELLWLLYNASLSLFSKFRQRPKNFRSISDRDVKHYFINTDKRRFKIQTSDMGFPPHLPWQGLNKGRNSANLAFNTLAQYCNYLAITPIISLWQLLMGIQEAPNSKVVVVVNYMSNANEWCKILFGPACQTVQRANDKLKWGIAFLPDLHSNRVILKTGLF